MCLKGKYKYLADLEVQYSGDLATTEYITGALRRAWGNTGFRYKGLDP